jgi:hypothetical protein
VTAEVWIAIGSGAKKFATGLLLAVSAGGVVIGGSMTVARPYIDAWFQGEFLEASEPILVAIRKLQESNDRLASQIALVDPRELLEFNGAPILLRESVRRGETIPVLYSLRRTEDCPTTIIVQFVSGELQRVDTALTYSIEATRSRVSRDFGNFVVDVRIPAGTQPGRYSYQPVAVPENCGGGNRRIAVPPTRLFEVTE